MAAVAHSLGAPLANNPHWNDMPEAGGSATAPAALNNRLDPDFNLV